MSTLQERLDRIREGIVRSVDADPDYTRRPEPETTLEVVRDLG
jgi:hypothetical protein